MNPTIKRIILGVRKYRNLVANGNFSNGTTGWTAIASSHSVTNKILSNTGSGTAAQPYSYQSLNWKAANVYYISAIARVTNANCLALSLSQDATEIVSQATPTQNSWYKLSGLLTASADASAHIRVRHRYADAATANGKVMEVDGNYGVTVINLTAIFGAGLEPSLEWCDKNILQNIIW